MKIDVDINKKYKNIQVKVNAPKIDSKLSNLLGQIRNIDVYKDRLEDAGKTGEIIKKSEGNKLSGQTILAYEDEKIYVFQVEEIICFYADGAKVMADTAGGSKKVKEKLYQLEELYKEHKFIRISKSVIVSIQYIKSIDLEFNGAVAVKLKNGRVEYISRRYVSKVKKQLGIGGR